MQSKKHKTMPALSLRPVPALLLALFAGAGAQAQERALAPVVVSEQAYSDTTTVVSEETLAARAARDTREALQGEPGIAVGGGGTAIAQKIYVREIEDTLLTVTLDGVPQGGNIFHHQGRVLIDPQLLKRVEIDKGGTVASVGPGGLAGSVRMTTRDARDLLRPGQTLGAMLGGGVASNDGWRGGATVYGAPGGGLDFLLYANRNRTEDYEDGNGNRQKNSGSTQDSQLAKLNYEVAPGHKLFVGYQKLEDEGIRFLRPHMPGLPNGPATPLALEQRTVTAGYRFAGGDGLPAAELAVFSDETAVRRTNSTAVFAKPVGYVYGEKLEASGLNLTLDSRLGAARVRYGLNHHERELEAINPVKRGVNGNTGREESDVTGLFAEGSLPLAERLLLGLGARYDWYSYTDNHNQTFKSSGLSPNASLTLMASEALALRLGASHTVRGPGLKEGFMIDNGPGPHIYRNVADLREEKANNVELGFNYDSGPWSLKGSVFHMEIDDYINFVFDTSARRQNVGKVESDGYELGAAWRQGALRAGISVSDSRPKLNGVDLGDGDFSLGVSTGRTWLLSAGYALPDWNLDLGWNARVVEKLRYRPAGASSELSKGGYAVHDLQASWQPLGKDRVRVTFSVRNVFDKFYYDQATYGYNATNGTVLGYAEPGRDVRLDLNWKF